MTINTNALKTYAPKARKDFIAAMITRAAKFGITKKEIAEQREQGDVVIVGADALPKKVGEQRKKLVGRIKKHGFEQAIEAVAYTWFNRLVAIRHMELHGLLDHGYRVLSHPSGKELPEILEHAEHLDLPGLDKSKVIDLKLDGTKDAELYRMLLIAQCNALHRAMPFLFERIDDETELLLPDNLLHSDSLIRKLVAAIDEADWQDIEVIGWLYQFYISEKKDEVFAGLKKNQKITADKIPAATQLFTPHWIVRYLVENSLGRLWLLNRPDSPLAEQMDYYIAPEEPETDFLKIGKPEEIKVCDPACGSGHMLTYAFDLLHAIYEEEGYDPKEIPAHILKNNLTGIELDDRAGALAAFALAMKAAEKLGRRRFLQMEERPDIVVLQDVTFTPEEMTDVQAVVGRDLFTDELRETLLQFSEAKNFGSLIMPKLRDPAATLRVVEARDFSSDLLLKEVQDRVVAVLKMAEALSSSYHVVLANPPYMASGGMNKDLKEFVSSKFPNSKTDLFSTFVERCLSAAVDKGLVAMVTIQNWMFLSSFKHFRSDLLDASSISTLLQIGFNSFPELNSKVVQAAAFCLKKGGKRQLGVFFNLNDAPPSSDKRALYLSKLKDSNSFSVPSERFNRLPGKPIAYFLSPRMLALYDEGTLGSKFDLSNCIQPGSAETYLRLWFEVSQSQMPRKWLFVSKGGDYRKWYGNHDHVINYAGQGTEMLQHPSTTLRSPEKYFQEGFVWTRVTSADPSFRFWPSQYLVSDAGPILFCTEPDKLALLNSKLVKHLLRALSPTLNVQTGDISALPNLASGNLREHAISLMRISQDDWEQFEISDKFQEHPVLAIKRRDSGVRDGFETLHTQWHERTKEMQRLEEEINLNFIDAYGLHDELTPEVPIEEITLTCNPAYRYGVKGTEEEREERLRSDTMKELISYAIGCMMGRYCLAEPGLIYANAGNEGFDASRYGDFPADDDGIVPITEVEWFDDDAALRFEEFLKAAWSPKTLRENLRFVAEGLAANGGNDPQKTIRNYISKSFFKDHLQTYKKRPIYWLFSSGKLRAFECLVYLHRYNESTLSRMRMEYVTPLQSRMAARIDQLDKDIAAASSSAARTKVQKEKDLMAKQLEELRTFDEELRHYADQRFTLDLDDGVKVNYGKFGNLLAERKAITGDD
jgi:hypothetical protein